MVNGTATSFDLPNFLGELFQKGEKPNAVLRLVGGLTGSVRLVATPTFAMGVDYTLPAANSAGKLEGAEPDPVNQGTNQSSNVVQIFHEAVSLTYSAQGATGALSGVMAIPSANGQGEVLSPRTIEWQRARAVERVARNANLAFLRGTYANPGDTSTARQTRGVRAAVATNLFGNGGTPRPVTKVLFEAALGDMVANGAFSIGDEVYCLANGAMYGAVIALYETAATLVPGAELAGVSVRRIATKWGVVNMVYEPDMAAGELFFFQPKYARVVGMPIPGKGLLFAESLGKKGSSDTEQIYGELGLDYRHEVFHGVLKDLTAA